MSFTTPSIQNRIQSFQQTRTLGEGSDHRALTEEEYSGYRARFSKELHRLHAQDNSEDDLDFKQDRVELFRRLDNYAGISLNETKAAWVNEASAPYCSIETNAEEHLVARPYSRKVDHSPDQEVGRGTGYHSTKYICQPEGAAFIDVSTVYSSAEGAATEALSLHAVVLGDSPANSYVENNPPLTSLRSDGLSLDLPAGRFAPRFS